MQIKGFNSEVEVAIDGPSLVPNTATYTALLTAGAAPIILTTTNLPGALAMNFPATADAAGSIDRWREDFGYPLAASAQNVAATIVAPIVTGAIWRITAGYYVAP